MSFQNKKKIVFSHKTVALSFIILQTLPIRLGYQEYGFPMCPKITKRKDYMQKHILTHTGERPYCCRLCNYACAQKSNLQKHMKTIHKIQD